MSPETLKQKEKDIIHPWPNTYTFTKSLSERALQKHREHIPLCIVRPAIIYAAYMEPFPGWTDSLAAGGLVIVFHGMGFLRNLAMNPNIRIDFVPVDFVSRAIILGTAYQSYKDSLTMIHSSTRHLSSITLKFFSDTITEYF